MKFQVFFSEILAKDRSNFESGAKKRKMALEGHICLLIFITDSWQKC